MKKNINKNIVLSGLLISMISLNILGFSNSRVVEAEEKSENQVIEKIIQNSKNGNDYESFEIMRDYFLKTDALIETKIDNKIAEQKAKEEAERIEKERIEREELENIYGSNNVSSGRTISIVGVDFIPFDGSEFKKYSNQAKMLYDAVLVGNASELTLDGFETMDDVNQFSNTFYDKYNVWSSSILSTGNSKYSCNYSAKEISKFQNYKMALNYVNNNIGNIVNNGMTETQAINAISKWIIDRCTYQLDAPSAISLLQNGSGNCNAYASTFKLMCDAINIPCDFVVGNAGGSHGWNRVLLNGNWHYVDLTFADTSGNSSYLLSSNLWGDHSLKKIDNSYVMN